MNLMTVHWSDYGRCNYSLQISASISPELSHRESAIQWIELKNSNENCRKTKKDCALPVVIGYHIESQQIDNKKIKRNMKMHTNRKVQKKNLVNLPKWLAQMSAPFRSIPLCWCTSVPKSRRQGTSGQVDMISRRRSNTRQRISVRQLGEALQWNWKQQYRMLAEN